MFDLPKYGQGLCLDRLARLLAALHVDRQWLARSSIVVCGSNGKGSTASFCAGIARACGLRVGLFTSPHLFHFSERFQIDGTPIDAAQLAAGMARVTAAIDALAGEHPRAAFGAFEAQFALACAWFQDSGCDLVVLEAGIGGRYDPVRLALACSTCVTSVDLEHTELLGSTLELIATDKSDACASGGTIVYGRNCLPLTGLLAEYNRARNVTGVHLGREVCTSREIIDTDRQLFDFSYLGVGLRALETRLMGSFQIDNAAVALAVLMSWLVQRHGAVDPHRLEQAALKGLRDARWAGRLEVVARDPLTIIDVGHTPDAIRQALASVRRMHGADGWLLVTGASADKRTDEMVALLAPCAQTIVCTRAHHKGAAVAGIADSARRANPEAAIHLADTIEEAVAMSQRLAREQGARVLVAGGLFLAVEYAASLRGMDPRSLQFL